MTFFSVSLFLLILLVSIFSEDRIVKMENLDEPRKKFKKEPDGNGHYFGPSLLEPICDAESDNGYVTYRDLKKKHNSENLTHSRHSQAAMPHPLEYDVSSYTPSHDCDGILERKPRGVTRTEVTLEDVAES